MELQSPINFHSQQNKYCWDYFLSQAISSHSNTECTNRLRKPSYQNRKRTKRKKGFTSHFQGQVVLLLPQPGSPSVRDSLAIMPARRKRKKEPDKPEIQSNLSEEEWIEKGKNSDFEDFFGLGNLFPHASHLYGRTFLCFWLWKVLQAYNGRTFWVFSPFYNFLSKK